MNHVQALISPEPSDLQGRGKRQKTKWQNASSICNDVKSGYRPSAHAMEAARLLPISQTTSDDLRNHFKSSYRPSVPVMEKPRFSTTHQRSVITYKTGDLFSCPLDESLAHCISADIKMGAGIALAFRKKFGRIGELKSQGAAPGGCAYLKDNQRYIFNLVTKSVYNEKPTYEDLTASLGVMRSLCEELCISKLAMPRIGCGLDGLQWPRVENLINEVFRETNIFITVYGVEQKRPTARSSFAYERPTVRSSFSDERPTARSSFSDDRPTARFSLADGTSRRQRKGSRGRVSGGELSSYAPRARETYAGRSCLSDEPDHR